MEKSEGINTCPAVGTSLTHVSGIDITADVCTSSA